MSHRAAIFDLDRTLLPFASGPIISGGLRQVGLLTSQIPGEALAFKIFNRFGENRASIMLAKQGPRAAKGWPQHVVREAGQLVVDDLVAAVHPWSRALLEQHREAGDTLVLATTTPRDTLLAFGEAMGFDHVVATQYRAVDGVYNGSIDGHFVWGRGKRAALVDLAAEHDLDLSKSSAYSDSYFDAPMLNEVGTAVAVNPDPRLTLLASVRGWTIRYLDRPENVPSFLGAEPQQLLEPGVRLAMMQWADTTYSGLENIPRHGPVIVAANHRSYFDPFVLALAMAKRDRRGRFLAKKELFDSRVTRETMEALGAIPVFRGSGSDKPLSKAAAALDAGELVVILPEGTIPRGEAFFDPKLSGRPGVAKLAAMTKAPVIPIGLWGTEKVWPRNAKLPKVGLPWQRPDVAATAGEPVELKYKSAKADTKRIMAAISDLLPPEAREAYEPTEAQLAATHPG